MTTTQQGLAAWLLEQIAEDEMRLVLVESAPPKWTMTVHPHNGAPIPVDVPALTPARGLATCAAHREIVEMSETDWITFRPAVEALAKIYSDREGYDPEGAHA